MTRDPHRYIYSKYNNQWDTYYSSEGWIGGKIHCNNTSQGYHAILLKWLEHYNTGSTVLLVSETQNTAVSLKSIYPQWQWVTTDLYSDLNGGKPDIELDMCGSIPDKLSNKFSAIVCQGTLEHVYDPMALMRNMYSMAEIGGMILIHTHTPPFVYHPYPRDYFRFHIDWFEDMGNYIPGMDLTEIVAFAGVICVAYMKTSFPVIY